MKVKYRRSDMAKKEYIKSEVTRAARPRSERLRSLGLQTSGGGGTTSAGGLASMYLETLRSRIDTHAKDTTVHVTADERSLWNSLASLFELVNIGTEENPLMAIQAKYGLFSNSFISARGSDPEAGSGGGGGGLDVQAMWYALAQPTNEKINVSHIPELTISKITGLQGELDSKLSGITGDMVTGALGYTPYDASQIGSASVKYAASAGKVAHALSIVAGDVTTVYDGSAAKSVSVPSAAQMALWDKVGGLFDLDADGNVYVKGNRGFYGNSFVSARGSDPGAGSGGGSGVDMDSVWYALGQPTTEKINVSHIPLLQQLSGTLTNAQLANSSLSVAGVSVPLGGSVSAEQIATALGLGSNAYTSTAYLPLTGGTMTGEILMTNSKAFVARMATDTSNYRTALGWRSVASGALIAQIGYWNTDFSITLNPCSDEVSEVWNDAVGKYNFVVGKNRLTYNTYPLLHSGNYTNYTVTKTGGGASGTWGISISGTAAYATVLSSDSSTSVSAYLKYRQIIGQTSLVGSNAANGAWCLPTTGGDAKYGNGQILRFGWAQNYYTDLHTGPNEIGSNSGLQFRQVIAGTVSSLGWRTLLDTANYSTTLDTRYVKKSGDTMNGVLSVSPYLDSPKGLFGLTKAQADSYAGDAYYNLAVGQRSPSMGASLLLYRDSASYQSYIVWSTGSADHVGVGLKNGTNDFDITNHKGAIKLTGQGILTYNNYTLWHAGNDGSGSGLDADLLDGYHATSFNLATNLGSCQDYGVYVIGLMQITDYSTAGNMANGTLIFIRQNGNNPAQKIIYSLSTQYSSNNVRFGYLTLSTNIYVQPCTFTYNGKKWAGFQVSSASSYGSGVVCVRDGLRLGERSTPFLLKYKASNTGAVINSEVNSSVVINGADIIESGVCSNAFSGNASSATKLATARLLWGRSFDGSGDISGNIIVGDAIIHGAVTSNNTRFISSDNASNIYFSVGGLVDLVAEPSCLRRGASNTSETLGTSTYRWANVYAVNGDYSGSLAVSGWINGGLNISIFGSNSDNSDTTRFLTYGHRVEFGGPGYAHVGYYLRPRYGANGATHADLFIQNASAAASPVFTNTHYFDHNGNAYHAAHVGIGMAPTGNGLDVNGLIHSTTGIYSDGYVSAKGQDTTSDARYKRDVAALPAQDALAVLMSLRPSTWSWRDDGRRGAGFVAQEVLGVLPEAVREVGGGKDKHLALNYQMLHAYEVCLLQTHETELERLRGRVNQLENEIKRIRHGA